MTAAAPIVADVMAPPELHVSDHTTIDKALAVLHGAHTDHVLIRDDEGQCAGIVTRDQLAAHCAQPWYTQATRVRDIPHDCSPFARPDMPLSEAEAIMRERSLAVWPVVDDDGIALGVLALGPELQDSGVTATGAAAGSAPAGASSSSHTVANLWTGRTVWPYRP